MEKTYRTGAIGALLDEYERAALEIKDLINRIPEEDFGRIVDPLTEDDDCRSVQTIVSHVIRSMHGYADYIRKIYSIPAVPLQKKVFSKQETLEMINEGLKYTAETLEGKWNLSDKEINSILIETSWGVNYDLEQILEHAIVHILRHRRQIDKFASQQLITFDKD